MDPHRRLIRLYPSSYLPPTTQDHLPDASDTCITTMMMTVALDDDIRDSRRRVSSLGKCSYYIKDFHFHYYTNEVLHIDNAYDDDTRGDQDSRQHVSSLSKYFLYMFIFSILTKLYIYTTCTTTTTTTTIVPHNETRGDQGP